MWKVLAFLVHVVLLGYVSMIYFQTSLINGMKPQSTHRDLGLEPPADRAVVFITAGLRAESFFRMNCSGVPRLRNIFLEQGLVGIARTPAPTQSRPGHIAIFGGFNEDPSAALTNFKKNPSAFDTVLNRTLGAAWGWGPQEMAEILSAVPNGGKSINFETYVPNKCEDPNQMDTFVLSKVRNFLSISENVRTVMAKDSSVFYVYLGDLEQAGHNDMPNTAAYKETLNRTQYIIAEIYNLFERKFSDGRNVYLMTSDHGMTSSGSHGGDSVHETEVPFFLWGAGVKHRAPNAGLSFLANDELQLPLHELDLIQFAPLISALIGLPPPLNNMAVLPSGFMNVTEIYEAHSLHLNALQLLAQVSRMLEIHQNGYIKDWMPRFERMDNIRIRHYCHQFYRQIQLGCLNEAMQSTQNIIRLALDSLDYYRNYYHVPLVLACLLTYAGWIYYLLANQSRKPNVRIMQWITVPMCILVIVELLLSVLLYLHKVPCETSFFLLVPILVWIFALREHGLYESDVLAPLMQLAWIMGIAVYLIASCYFRKLIAFGYLVAVCANNRKAFTRPSLKFFLWLMLVIVLTVFSVSRPDFGSAKKCLLYGSMALTVLRPLVLNENHRWRVWASNVVVLLLGVYCVERHLANKFINPIYHGVAWAYVIYAIISIPYGNTTNPKRRIQLILFNLSTIYCLLCQSYEPIFMQVLCSECMLNIKVHELAKLSKEEAGGEEDKPAKLINPIHQLHSNYRFAGLILIYALFSCYGAGTMPHVGNFDLDTARVFLSEVNPFVISVLIALKLLIPVAVLLSILYAFVARARQHTRGIYISILVICTTMCLYFFFFARNQGSWENVRDYVSQLIIVYGLPMLLLAISWLPMQFLSAIPLTMLPMLEWNTPVIHIEQPSQSVA